MKKLVFLIALLSASSVFSQTAVRKQLTGSWTASDISLVDGSKVYDPEIREARFDLRFLSADSIMITFNSKTVKQRYTLSDSVLSWGGLSLKIITLSDVELVADQLKGELVDHPLKISFIPKKLFDLTYTPQSYLAKNGREVFIYEPGRIEPLFLDTHRSALDFIVEKFNFSEFRRGGFVVRFVVTETGDVAGIRVVASSNERFDKSLEKAVAQTKGKWVSAEFRGKPVAAEVEFNLNLGWTDDQAAAAGVDSLSYSNEYLRIGQDYMNYKQTRLAEQNFTKAISFNPMNVEAYYQRAAAYVVLRKREEACKDYQQLVYLQQAKAKELYDRYCGDASK